MEQKEKYVVDYTPGRGKFEEADSYDNEAGTELKGLRAWAQDMQLQLPEGYEASSVTYTYKEACDIFRNIGLIPNTPSLNPVQIAALAAFPTIEKAFFAKLQDGYKFLTLKYEADERIGREKLDIIFSKDYERYALRQEKGPYAGGFSHATFGREDEQGEIL